MIGERGREGGRDLFLPPLPGLSPGLLGPFTASLSGWFVGICSLFPNDRAFSVAFYREVIGRIGPFCDRVFIRCTSIAGLHPSLSFSLSLPSSLSPSPLSSSPSVLIYSVPSPSCRPKPNRRTYASASPPTPFYFPLPSQPTPAGRHPHPQTLPASAQRNAASSNQ